MRHMRRVALGIAVALFSHSIIAQDSGALRSEIAAVEAQAWRKAAGTNTPEPTNRASRLVTVAATAAPSVPKEANLTPPGPVPVAHGDIPPSGFCDIRLPIGKSWIPWECNDKTSSLEVPFGYQVTVCEHDGEGPKGYGQCRDYPPGNHDLQGSGFGDVATFFDISDRMAVYLSSADDEIPAAIKPLITYTHKSDGGKVGVDIRIDDNWYAKNYSVELPPGCNIQVWETTKAGVADWIYSVQNGRLNINLRVKPRMPFAGNNWVGVGFRCSS